MSKSVTNLLRKLYVLAIYSFDQIFGTCLGNLILNTQCTISNFKWYVLVTKQCDTPLE